MIENREMAIFASNLWENYIKQRNKEADANTVSFYKAEVTAKPGNGVLTIKRPLDTAGYNVAAPSYMDNIAVGGQVLVLRFGNDNNLTNHFVVDNAARTMLASAISSSGSGMVSFSPTLTAGAEAGVLTIDGTDQSIFVPNVAYATSDSQNTLSLTATVVNEQPFTLTTGAMVAVKFTYAKPYQAVQYTLSLNVNSTGAKAIRCNGSSLLAVAKEKSWGAGDVVLFVYDGTYWQWVSKERMASTSEYGIVQLSSDIDSTSTLLAATPAAVKAAYDLAASKSDTDTTYTLSISGNVITLTGSDETESSVNLPEQTTYTLSMDGNVITLTGSDESASSVTLPEWDKYYIYWDSQGVIQTSPTFPTGEVQKVLEIPIIGAYEFTYDTLVDSSGNNIVDSNGDLFTTATLTNQ